MSASRGTAILALLLLVPAASLGVASAMIFFPGTWLGPVIFGAAKAWLFGLPLAWRLLVERQPISLSPPRHGGFAVAAMSGLAISLVIWAAYLVAGARLIDRGFFVDKLTAVGLGSPAAYAGGAAYWILVNSVLEECVWRWFCVRQCEQLLPRGPAVILSGLFFTVHHVVALRVYMGPIPTLLCSLGIFTGGAIWSWMYTRYRSIWPGYVSHAIVDLCVFGLGAWLLFGPAAP
ncbi:MAG TPA: type II CAAX endopeptidase family protein [Kiritimatiellia bacterium]|nr:type II CAAX endopeptidase family protein [Kiritimatiellia bacterium]HRZ11163.1 type II CAAX endopeptidase family protein [Kiritimatiellia bacterium]HSA19465.1 type II CAAX endopeptidase family protein [Kiritimatiellia bacterium]